MTALKVMPVTKDLVVEKACELPGFPRVIAEIVATIDDPEANLDTLAELVKLDPVIAARVLSLANVAASRTRHLREIRDIFTAISLIGLGQVRQMALISSWGEFVARIGLKRKVATFWEHSVAVGICAEEIALYADIPVPSGSALVAGLLHDIGQIWLYRFNPESFREAWSQALAHAESIETTELRNFGTSHSHIGAWLAENWSLPPAIVAGIRYHHECDSALDEPIVPVIHIAEVLSNALDLTGRKENRVSNISTTACRRLGITWNEASRTLFGRIDARSRHANAFFA